MAGELFGKPLCHTTVANSFDELPRFDRECLNDLVQAVCFLVWIRQDAADHPPDETRGSEGGHIGNAIWVLWYEVVLAFHFLIYGLEVLVIL